jgi:hypothetical protein
MAIPIRNNEAQDADAVYILGKIKAADDCEAVATSKASDARQFRIEAGLRLIEVRARLVADKDPSATSWNKWLEQNGINKGSAHRLTVFAGFSEEQREEHKAKEAARKREERAKAKPEFKLVWNMVLIQALGENVTRAIKRGYKSEVEQLMGEEIPSHFTSEEEADAFVDRYLHIVGLPKDAERDPLPKSAEEKLQRAVRVETGRLHRAFNEQVEQKVSTVLADRMAHLEECERRALEQLKRYQIMANGIKPIISKDDYRFLLNVLHSDRTPEKEKLDKAFIIVKKLEPYIEAT